MSRRFDIYNNRSPVLSISYRDFYFHKVDMLSLGETTSNSCALLMPDT